MPLRVLWWVLTVSKSRRNFATANERKGRQGARGVLPKKPARVLRFSSLKILVVRFVGESMMVYFSARGDFVKLLNLRGPGVGQHQKTLYRKQTYNTKIYEIDTDFCGCCKMQVLKSPGE